MKEKSVSIASILLLFLAGSLPADENSLYGTTDPRDYLSGRFSPARHQLFVRCRSVGIPTDGRTHYLRKETAAAFKKLYDAFQKEHPDISLYITSATRNFHYQKAIWQGKFTGKRLVNGKRLPESHPDTYQRTLKILEYSAMPGTSRHHWGTDLDINKLVNSYYETGEGKKIYAWMKDHAAEYGFYEVYTAGRDGGYNNEKWHWSYLPVSRHFYRDWIEHFGESTAYFSAGNAFGGSQYADRCARKYVTEINPLCKR